ncbi:MAG: lysophospholipid acyltransferase family protein [Candidatus Promineifilaceae bacterium]|jgi:1-acyl-sn-glycerol-3-phosphate acyltransferase
MAYSSESTQGMPELGKSIPRRGGSLSKASARAIMSAAGWKITGEVPDEPKILLVGAPHTSNWDYIFTVLTTYSLGVDLHFVAKHSLFKKPLGGLMRRTGGIPLNRSTSEGFVEQMVEEFNKRDSLMLAIMPEGTRSREEACQWRSGFYHIAQGAGVPITLVIFDYGRKIMHLGPTFWPSGEYEADLAEIQSYYVGIEGKHPR